MALVPIHRAIPSTACTCLYDIVDICGHNGPVEGLSAFIVNYALN